MNINTNKGKKITIDDLAVMVMAGFKELKEDISNLDFRLSNQIGFLDSRLTSLELRVGSMDKKLDSRFDELSLKIDNLSINKVDIKDHRKLEKKISR